MGQRRTRCCPNWVTNRYVPWTSWRAGAQQWGLSSIRQGESSGTITHEIVHTFGLPDNNNNPYVTPYHRVGTGPWDILDRGSFNGPGGPHKRWLVPVTQGGAMEAGMTLWTKLQRGLVQRGRRAPRHAQRPGASGVQTMRVQARTVEPERRRHADRHQARPRRRGAVDKTPACDTNTDPLCAGTGWQYYTLETVQRIGEDSMTPDSGVLINKNKNNSIQGCGYSCFSWTIDAHPEDINMVDFLRPRTKTPVMRTIGDYRQLNDALFHAGTARARSTSSSTAQPPALLRARTSSATRPACSPTTSPSATSTAPARTRAASRDRQAGDAGAGRRVSSCTCDAQEHRHRRPGDALRAAPLDDPNPYVGSDVYRLKATGGDVHLDNEIVADQGRRVGRRPGVLQGHGLGHADGDLRERSVEGPRSRTCAPGTVGGTVPATLSLTLGTPAAFGAFTPGITKDYTASTTANVISTAGDAALSVARPVLDGHGHLVNGVLLAAAAAAGQGPHGDQPGRRRW